jgi:hypothetical protein
VGTPPNWRPITREQLAAWAAAFEAPTPEEIALYDPGPDTD